MKTILVSIVLAIAVATPGAATADDCRTNCVAIFKVCKQSCIENTRGAVRRGCIKRLCQVVKRNSIRLCRHGQPEQCPPIP